MNSKSVNKPSQKDLVIWSKASEDLLDHLYTGITGKFQINGHKQIGKWSEKYKNKIVVEIGSGHGHHLEYCGFIYEKYIGVDILWRFVETMKKKYLANVINGDVYRLPYADQSVDCILSIYNFEHLKVLEQGINEVRRVLKPDGELLVGLPAEGGLAYSIGRNFTSKPYMEKKYGIDYDAIVHYEHCNTYQDVISSLKQRFKITTYHYIPFPFFHSVHLNAVICLKAIPLLG